MAKRKDIDPFPRPAPVVRQSTHDRKLIPDQHMFQKKELCSGRMIFDFDEEVIINQLEILKQRIKHL